MKSFALSMEPRAQQILSPRLQQAVRLLHMSSTEYAQALYESAASNPFLDLEEAEDARPGAGLPATGVLATAEARAEAGEAEPAGLTVSADGPGTVPDDGAAADAAPHDADEHVPGAPAREGGASVLDLQASRESLGAHLLSQLRVLSLSGRDRQIAEAIVGSLEDDGYLRLPLQEIAGVSGLTPPPDGEELKIALSRVQALDPPGVGARDLRECLLLQLGEIACPVRRALAGSLIRDHLQKVAAGDIAGVARALRRPPAAVHEALGAIRRLAPRPGWRFDAQTTQYITPDVIVRKQRGVWTVQLNPTVIPRVRLHQTCASLFHAAPRAAQHGEMAAHLQEARWTLNNIEQRFATILGIAEAIVRRQRHFLDYGPMAMKPLGLREIAEEVGVHESTVSRVTSNKYMATPQGVFELKHFFSRALATANGGACSATSIRSLIQELIAAEDPAAPMSDADLAQRLAREGVVIARRTVTKYRQALRIEPFERRRTPA
ncbi:MAG: RNA polymerase factor sigma-54 [Candidatus Dactylopiibacterium sp.]|nr:RNA polymerase factor sigma-54 [Candidatus Dactylopiibacterium sp.]